MSSNSSSTQGPIAGSPLSGRSLGSTKSRSRFLCMRAPAAVPTRYKWPHAVKTPFRRALGTPYGSDLECLFLRPFFFLGVGIA